MSLPKQGAFSSKHFSKSFMGSESKRQTDRQSANKISVSKFSNIEQYRKNQAVKLGNQRYEQIKQVLQIQHQSKKRCKERIKNHQNYLHYKKNPFLVKDTEINQEALTERNRENISTNGRAARLKYDNIIDGLNNLKNKLEINNLKAVVPKLQKKVQEINVQKFMNYDREVKLEDARSAVKLPSKYSENEVVYKKYETQPVQNLYQELDNLVNIKQVNFYQKRDSHSEINLFRVLFLKQGQKILERGPRFLQKYYFCQDSMMKQKENSMLFNPGDHISTKQRHQIQTKKRHQIQTKKRPKIQTNKRHQIQTKKKHYIQTNQNSEFANIEQLKELDLNLQMVKFEDLLNVAGARVDSFNVLSYLNGLKQINFLKNEDLLVYKKNQKNQQVTKTSVKQNPKDDLNYLMQRPNSPTEDKQRELSQFYRKKLENLLKKERSATVQSNIKDARLVTSFIEQKDEIVKQQIDSLINKSYAHKEVQTLVRINKISKDRCVNIKNSIVLSTIISKRVYENASKSKSRSKSKMLNWR